MHDLAFCQSLIRQFSHLSFERCFLSLSLPLAVSLHSRVVASTQHTLYCAIRVQGTSSPSPTATPHTHTSLIWKQCANGIYLFTNDGLARMWNFNYRLCCSCSALFFSLLLLIFLLFIYLLSPPPFTTHSAIHVFVFIQFIDGRWLLLLTAITLSMCFPIATTVMEHTTISFHWKRVERRTITRTTNTWSKVWVLCMGMSECKMDRMKLSDSMTAWISGEWVNVYKVVPVRRYATELYQRQLDKTIFTLRL